MIYTFAGTIASFIDDDWNLIERVIDFKPLEDKEHEAFHAARAFISGARQIGSLDKMSRSLSFTNAFCLLCYTSQLSQPTTHRSTMLSSASRLATLLTLYNTPENPDRHIRCLAHIINLVVQDILAALDESDPCSADGGETDHYLLHKDAPIHYSIDDDEDLRELEANRNKDLATSDADVDELTAALDEKLQEIGRDMEVDTEEPAVEPIDEQDEELSEVRMASELKRLRFIVTKITSSPQRRQSFWQLTNTRYGDTLSDPKLPTSARLAELMVAKDGIDDWVYSKKEYRDLALSTKDWDNLMRLRDILQPFSEATLLLSTSSAPTLPLVLPIYANLEQQLNTGISNQRYPLQVREALKKGRTKLHKYMVPAKSNHLYICATVLNPFFRAHWFGSESGRAEVIVSDIAHRYMNDMDDAEPVADCNPSSHLTVSSLSASSSSGLLKSLGSFEVPMAPLPARMSKSDRLEDELKRYFKFEGGRGDMLNPLPWWKV
ncbi:ribonuclease H-like domain-containing protein, partial [Coprinopsis sp. MPI-PUGE-AT-0042]